MVEQKQFDSVISIGGGYRRDVTIDLVKGIGIILMVLRHARAPYSDFVLLFHMAIFFIASGYLYNGSKIVDIASFGTYVVKKIKGLWLPYFSFNSIYILCNNLFVRANIYTDNSAFLIADGPEVTYRSLAEYFSLKDIVKQIVKAACFHGDTQIGGALWFFYVLFVVLILYAFTELMLVKIKDARLKMLIKGFIAAILLMAGYVCMLNGISIKGLNRVFSVYSLVYVGELLRNWSGKGILKDRVSYNFGGLVIAFVVLILCYHHGYIDLSSNSIENPVFFLVVSTSGWFMLYSAALLLERWRFVGNSMICYISIHSVPIIGLHFLCFKIINAAAVVLTGQETYMIASHPVLMYNGGWWLLYTFVGLMFPLVFNALFWRIQQQLLMRRRRN